jgi:hypothetical protein
MPHLPMTIALRSITCNEETDEVGADEPFVIVTACDLGTLVPTVNCVLYGPFSDVDKGETHATLPLLPGLPGVFANSPHFRRTFWPVNGQATAPLPNPDERTIFIASLVENDDGSPEAARTLVQVAATAALAGSTAVSRPIRVQRLIEAIGGALRVPTGAPNFDDLVGSRELALTPQDTDFAGPGARRTRSLSFAGDGGRYTARFDLVAP